MSRRIRDAALSTTKALPAANANNNHDAIDLGAVTPYPTTEAFVVELSVPALPNLANSISATFTFQDSANGTDFASIAGLATLVMTGAGGTGAPAASRTVMLPPNVRRYVRVNQAVANTGGDNTAVSSTVRLLF
jgi:hypothetical protein